jgi:hypothetical protein
MEFSVANRFEIGGKVDSELGLAELPVTSIEPSPR